MSLSTMPMLTMDHHDGHRPTGRVGYWWSEKKSRKFNVNEFSELCRSAGLELVKINLDQPLDEQGPFDVILHKLSDVVVKAAQGNETCKIQIHNVEEYFKQHPEVIIIDPLPNVEKLLDRFRQYKNIEESELGKEEWVFTPSFVELTTTDQNENLRKLEDAGVTFPFVCKPSVAHGSSFAHQMALIFNKRGLKDISPPCVAQSFISHNAVLYKLFIVGRRYYVIERPSLKNFYASDQETIFFDSHDISKPHSASALTELDDDESKLEPKHRPEKEYLDRIVQVMQQQLGLSLFGIDVIIENGTGRYAIIDMNAFPGYDGVDNCLELLRDLVVDHLRDRWMLNHIVAELNSNDNNKSVLPSNALVTKSELVLSPSALVPNGNIVQIQPCYCCPIASSGEVCHNMCCIKSHISSSMNEQFKIPEIPIMMTTTSISTPDEFTTDSNQDDSGIDTSDSCDEKKNKPPQPLRVVKRFHSRTHAQSNSVIPIPVIKSSEAS